MQCGNLDITLMRLLLCLRSRAGARVHVGGAHERAHPEGGGEDRGQGILRRLARPHHLQQGQVQVRVVMNRLKTAGSNLIPLAFKNDTFI